MCRPKCGRRVRSPSTGPPGKASGRGFPLARRKMSAARPASLPSSWKRLKSYLDLGLVGPAQVPRDGPLHREGARLLEIMKNRFLVLWQHVAANGCAEI